MCIRVSSFFPCEDFGKLLSAEGKWLVAIPSIHWRCLLLFLKISKIFNQLLPTRHIVYSCSKNPHIGTWIFPKVPFASRKTLFCQLKNIGTVCGSWEICLPIMMSNNCNPNKCKPIFKVVLFLSMLQHFSTSIEQS